jgi:hypothetical protein
MTKPSHSSFCLSVPSDFPGNIPSPLLCIGDRVCWHPLPTQEFGVITGLEYAPAEHLSDWSWKYVVRLDPRSPSHEWTHQDSAWEDDLALYNPELATEEQL